MSISVQDARRFFAHLLGKMVVVVVLPEDSECLKFLFFFFLRGFLTLGFHFNGFNEESWRLRR